MRRIAFVTYQALPNLSSGDQLVLPYLHELDTIVVAVAWDDPAVAWEAFDAVILRSCWDYHLRPVELRQRFEQIKLRGNA